MNRVDKTSAWAGIYESVHIRRSYAKCHLNWLKKQEWENLLDIVLKLDYTHFNDGLSIFGLKRSK
jgi:hypothetical protein